MSRHLPSSQTPSRRRLSASGGISPPNRVSFRSHRKRGNPLCPGRRRTTPHASPCPSLVDRGSASEGVSPQTNRWHSLEGDGMEGGRRDLGSPTRRSRERPSPGTTGRVSPPPPPSGREITCPSEDLSGRWTRCRGAFLGGGGCPGGAGGARFPPADRHWRGRPAQGHRNDLIGPLAAPPAGLPRATPDPRIERIGSHQGDRRSRTRAADIGPGRRRRDVALGARGGLAPQRPTSLPVEDPGSQKHGAGCDDRADDGMSNLSEHVVPP